MSCQRGNVSRERRQKHQNVTAFRNNLHDNSKRTKYINEMEIAEVCKRCQEVIAWKVKYKRYKPLSQPKTCIKCHKKTIKDAYHIVCITCAKDLDICCKCGKKEEIVAHHSPPEAEKMRVKAEMELEVKALPERKRRAYYRHIEKLEGKKRKKRVQQTDSCDPEGEETETADKEEAAAEPAVKLSFEEYIKSARMKLDELTKGMDDDLLDDFDDLEISSDDDDDEWEDEN